MKEDNRKSNRITKAVNLQYSSNIDGTQEVWHTASVRNIGIGGACFSADNSFQANEIIKIRFKLPNNPFQWIELIARVVSSKSLTVGMFIERVEFVGLTDENKKAIGEYIALVSK